MFKIFIMAALIFMGMVGYDSLTDTKTQPAAPAVKQEQKVSGRQAALAVFLALLPSEDKWPEPVKKVFLAISLEERLIPLRERGSWTNLEDMSPEIPKALIAIEDHDFYDHGAISLDGVLRAILANLNAGEVVQGGSTLTQQMVKNVFLSGEQSMERKIEEAVLALAAESKLSKDEILELYLNTAYLGAGATGVKDACSTYFNKKPAAVSLAEAAVLAALPYAPSLLNPLENPEECKKRQLLVLNAMLKYGMITQGQLDKAKSETVYLANGRSL